MFFELLKNEKFSKVVAKCISKPIYKKMIGKIKHCVRKLLHIAKQLIVNPRGISWVKYVYYNYMCKSVIREGKSKIIPYKNAIINIDKTARIYVRGRNIEIGINKLRKSKAETHVDRKSVV